MHFAGAWLLPKQEQSLTMIVVLTTIIVWGKLHVDLVYCNKVGQILRSFGIKLPARGFAAAEDRDLGKVLMRKFHSVRNKMGMYTLPINTAELCTEGVKLLERGLKIHETEKYYMTPDALAEGRARIERARILWNEKKEKKEESKKEKGMPAT